MGETLAIINKWGVTAVMAIAIVWFNARLNSVEDKLYDCYEKRLVSKNIKTGYNYEVLPRQVAILPNEIKIEKDDKR